MTGEDAKLETTARFNSTHGAFPSPVSPGLTKREYFAAAALKGLMAFDWQDADAAATEAVMYADALLLALARETDEVDVEDAVDPFNDEQT